LIGRKGTCSNTLDYVDCVQLGDVQNEEWTAKSTTIDETPSCEDSVTETEVSRIEEIQSNLEVIATLVFCCVNGKIPENELLEISNRVDGGDIHLNEGDFNEETKLVEQKRLLTEKDFVDFKTSIERLLLDVRRLRGYITKKYTSELTEQCYVQ